MIGNRAFGGRIDSFADARFSWPLMPACCSRRSCRCCSWARNSPHRRPFCIFATSDPSSQRRSRPDGGANSNASQPLPTRPRSHASLIRIPRDIRGIEASLGGAHTSPSPRAARPHAGAPRLETTAARTPSRGAAARRALPGRGRRPADRVGSRRRSAWRLLAHFGPEAVETAQAPGGEVIFSAGVHEGPRSPCVRLDPGAVRVVQGR